MSQIERVIPKDPELAITEEMVSITAINPFMAHNSSPRSIMLSSHLSQALTLEFGDEKIMQTGLEKQLSENTFSRKLESDAKIKAIIKRYNGIDVNSVTQTTELLVIFQDIETGELDYLELPYFHKLHQYFGFKYKWNYDVLDSAYRDQIIPRDTVLADSPSVSENGGYKFGVNANVLLATFPEVAEDGVIISESLAKKFQYKIYETRVVEFGVDSFPLNLYGTADNYKPFPEIGEVVNDDSILMAVRKYEPELSPALTSKRDVMEANPLFDRCHYVKKGGMKVVDIKATHSPKFKKEVYNGTADQVNKYVKGYIHYYNQIINAYEEEERAHYRMNKNNKIPLSDKFSKLLLDAYAIANPAKRKIQKTYKNEPTDIYRIEFVLECTVDIKSGAKITDMSGAKGVAVDIRPDDKMPQDPVTGEYSDIVMDPKSIASRMNVGRLYEQYFNGASRQVRYRLRTNLTAINSKLSYEDIIETLSDKDTITQFTIVTNFLKIIGTQQFTAYNQLIINRDIDAIKEILVECVTKEVHILYTVSSDLAAYQVVEGLKNSEYAVVQNHVWIYKDGERVLSKEKVTIAPLYLMLLFKTADEFLSVASAKTNHYHFPIGASKAAKTELPYRANPTKIISETETRLFVAYGGREATAELKDRANSIVTHRIVYDGILRSDNPTNIPSIIDRSKHPFGGDSAIGLVSNIFHCAGVEFEYVPEK